MNIASPAPSRKKWSNTCHAVLDGKLITNEVKLINAIQWFNIRYATLVDEFIVNEVKPISAIRLGNIYYATLAGLFRWSQIDQCYEMANKTILEWIECRMAPPRGVEPLLLGWEPGVLTDRRWGQSSKMFLIVHKDISNCLQVCHLSAYKDISDCLQVCPCLLANEWDHSVLCWTILNWIICYWFCLRAC